MVGCGIKEILSSRCHFMTIRQIQKILYVNDTNTHRSKMPVRGVIITHIIYGNFLQLKKDLTHQQEKAQQITSRHD